jgi:putative MATE family efflux protein
VIILYSKKDLLRLFFPAFVEIFLSTAIGVVNTMMVSGVGDYAVSGVAIVDSINFVAMNLFMAVSTGATVVIAQNLGSGNKSDASKTSAQSITTVILLSLISGLGLFLFGGQIINLLFGNAEQAVKSAAKTYLVCSAISYPLLGTFNIFTGILRANNNFRASMLAAVASNIVNFLVGALCIFHFHLGVLGAGIGLIFARLFGTFVLAHPLFRSPKILISKLSYKINLKILKPVLYIGIPAGLDSLVFNGGKLLVQTLVSSLGTASLAANSIASSMNSIINIPGSAIAIVSVTVIGCYAGAGLKEDIKKMINKLTLYSMILLGGVSLVVLPFASHFLRLYSPKEDVLQMALHITYLTLACIPIFWSAAFIVPACLRSTGDVVYITVISILSMWIIRVLGGYLLIRYTSLGLMGIWIAWCFDWVTRGVPFYGRVLSRRYEKHLPQIKTDCSL